MITVIYDAEHYALEISGHAGAGEYGSDLVCCAASTLSYALEAHLAAHSEYNGEVLRKEAEARFLATARPDAVHELRCGEVFETIMDGLRLLQHNYPDNVNIEERTM